MQPKLLLLVTAAFTIPMLANCQTNSRASASEIAEAVQPVEDVAAKVKAEVCRGQAPERIDAETYNSWPSSAQVWFTNRLSQYKRGCVD